MFWIFLIGSYLMGGIPFGFIVAKAKGIDILSVGSKSTGATNVGRILGKKAYFFVLFLDVVKGILPSAIAPIIVGSQFGLSPKEIGLICGLAAVIGHIFSPFLKFKGGKGIATGLGVLLGGTPIVATIVLIVWGITFGLTRYVSLASILAVVAMLISGFFIHSNSIIFISVFIGMCVFIVVKHRTNIGRLLRNEESKFSFSSSKLSEEALAKPIQDDQPGSDI